MTNGQITKKIYAACQKLEGEALTKAVSILLHSFPLSSHKLVYDRDESKVPAAAWETLIAACITTDKEKLEHQTRWLESMGVEQDRTSFGRFELVTA